MYHNKNQGKGAAIRTALLSATGNYVIIQDADLEYDPSDIPKLLSVISTSNVVLVIGELSAILSGDFTSSWEPKS